MAAIPVSSIIREQILQDWRMKLGSQADLADKYKVSKGFVNGVCKGVEQDAEAIVNAGVQYKQMLATQDDSMVNAVQHEVEERTKHIVFFNNATVKNLTIMLSKLTEENSIMEHRIAQAAIKDGKETVLGKTPDTAIQVNNNSTLRELSNEELYVIASKGR